MDGRDVANGVCASQLFTMTPYAHSANAIKRALCIDDPSAVTIDFKIFVYQLTAEQV